MTAPVVADLDTAGDVLAFWHPVDDAPVDESYLPAGEVAAGSSADTLLRVRNLSGDYTAAAVVVAVGAPADPALADLSAAHLVSADGQTFAATCALGDLAPQQTSAVLVLRRILPPDTGWSLGGWTVTATAGDWVPAAVDVNAAVDGGADTTGVIGTATDTTGQATQPADQLGDDPDVLPDRDPDLDPDPEVTP